MNRIDRLAAILTHLQSKKLVKAQQIADRFEISLRTVYRDVRALEEAGVPIIGEAGAGYSLVEGYRLPPVMFTEEEAMAFVLAEKIAEKFLDGNSVQHYKAAMYKIRAVLRSGEKEVYEKAEDHVEIRKNPIIQPQADKPNTIPVIMQGILQKQVISMTYQGIDKAFPSGREVEPVGVYFYFDHWYMIAFCRKRAAYRTFRIDRVKSLHLQEENYKDRHPSLKAYLKELEAQRELTKVVILVDRSVVPYLGNEKYNYGFVLQSDKGDKVEMTFMLPYEGDFVRWFTMFAEYADLVYPERLRDQLEDRLQQKWERLKKSASLLT